MQQVGGDDLDDFEIEQGFIPSGSEAEWMDPYEIQGMESTEENSDSGKMESVSPAVKKRKREQKDSGKSGKSPKKTKLANAFNTLPESASIAAQSPPLLAEYLIGMQARSYSDLTILELDDIRIPNSAIADTTAWTGPRTLDHLVEFITTVTPTLRTRLSQRSKLNGAPTLLFLTAAALRVVDLTRVLKQSKALRGEKSGEVAKLFARHFKLAEHTEYLKRTKVGVAIGTPGRVGKLLAEPDALSVSALTHIFIDTTYRDAKKRSLFDINETRDELFKTVLGSDKVMQVLKSGKATIVLF